MLPSKVSFLAWSTWLLRIGLICIIINSILLYIIISFVVIPFLDRGGRLDGFQLCYDHKQPSILPSVLDTVDSSFVNAATQIPSPSPTYYCSARSCLDMP